MLRFFPSGGTSGQLGDSLRNGLPHSSVGAGEVDAVDLGRVSRRLFLVAQTNVVAWAPELLQVPYGLSDGAWAMGVLEVVYIGDGDADVVLGALGLGLEECTVLTAEEAVW